MSAKVGGQRPTRGCLRGQSPFNNVEDNGSNLQMGHEKRRLLPSLKWPLQDLNLRPTDYESAALTAELRGR